MFVWLLENIATIIVCIGLLAAVAASVFSMIRSKKKVVLYPISSCLSKTKYDPKTGILPFFGIDLVKYP